MNNTTWMSIRTSRFLGERYRQRERPGYFADLFLLGSHRHYSDLADVLIDPRDGDAEIEGNRTEGE